MGLPGQSWGHTRVLVARAKGGGPQGLWEGLPALCHCHLQPAPVLRGSGEGLGLKREVDWGLGVRQFSMGIPRWLSNKESTCQCGRAGFDPWVRSLGRENPWRRKWQPTPVLLPGEFPWTEEPGGLQSMGSQRVSD